MFKTIRQWLNAAADVVLPRTCPVCGRSLDGDEPWLCRRCMAELPRTHYEEQPYDNTMAQVFWGHFRVEKVAAWFFYQPSSPFSGMIHELKYNRQREIGHFIGRVAAEELSRKHFFDDIDLLIPIPLTKRRQRQRGYNQSLEIARGIVPEDEIYLRVNKDNVASQKVMLKNGARIAGEDDVHFFMRIKK